MIYAKNIAMYTKVKSLDKLLISSQRIDSERITGKYEGGGGHMWFEYKLLVWFDCLNNVWKELRLPIDYKIRVNYNKMGSVIENA